MLPHEDAQERIVSVLIVTAEFLLKQTADLDAEVAKRLKQIETGSPSVVATFTKFPLLQIEVLGLFGLRRTETLDKLRAQLIDMCRSAFIWTLLTRGSDYRTNPACRLVFASLMPGRCSG